MRRYLLYVLLACIALVPATAAPSAGLDHDPGMIGAGSPLYGLEIALDNAAMNIGLKKAGNVAQERAAEAKKAQKEGNTKAAQGAADEIGKAAAQANDDDRHGLEKARNALEDVKTHSPVEAQKGLDRAINNINRRLNRSTNRSERGNSPDDGSDIDPGAERHSIGITPDGDVDSIKEKADNVTRVMDFSEIGKTVTGVFSQQALESLKERDDVRYIEPVRTYTPPDPPEPGNYTCPAQDTINCMPPVTEEACVGDYHNWIQSNCDVQFAY